MDRTFRLNSSPFVLDRMAYLVRHFDLTPHTALHAARLMHAHPSLWITSGRRTWLRNRQVGGAKNSFHLHGRACDFAAELHVLRAALETARKQRVTPRCTGPEEAFLEQPGGHGQHLHVAW